MNSINNLLSEYSDLIEQETFEDYEKDILINKWIGYLKLKDDKIIVEYVTDSYILNYDTELYKSVKFVLKHNFVKIEFHECQLRLYITDDEFVIFDILPNPKKLKKMIKDLYELMDNEKYEKIDFENLNINKEIESIYTLSNVLSLRIYES